MPQPSSLPSYAVVTPVRDEAEHLPRLARALAEQHHRPLEWVVVDDGSTDGTREIAERLASAHDWIRVMAAGARHERARGAPIVLAFAAGRAALRERPDVVVKLDGDLYLPPQYFAWVAEVFRRDRRAGVVGGVAYVFDDGRWVQDGAADNVNGVAKAYRSDCLDDIGGLRPSMGWDGIDEYGARARGWRVHVLTELPILHFRRRGTAQSWYAARWEEGRGNHFMGYLWSWIVVRAAYRMLVERPPVLGGIVLFLGFATARLARRPQVDDPAAREELHREQRARLRALARGRTLRRSSTLAGGGPAFWAGEDEVGAA